jgi:glycosyltransferase involved in cell wall biosynthesis
MGPEPAVSVIVPARNAAATLGRTLDCLARQDIEAEIEVIVVDDGSGDATASIARAHPVGATVIENDLPPGPGSARNRGARVARAPWLAFTDADCYPTGTWLSRGLEAVDSLDLVQGAVGPDPEVPLGPFDRTVVVTAERGLYETANLLVRRDLFERIGGFEDWILEDGVPPERTIGEDVLFGWTARRAGARTGFAAQALVHHAVFRKGPLEAIRYRWAWRHLPALASRIPELREQTFYRRWFFERRSALFDLAIAAGLLAAVLRRPLPLLAAVPYAQWVWQESVRWEQHGRARVALVTVGVDSASCVALVVGSVGWRAVLI